LRPGEKLFEELRIEGEDMSPTYHEKIKIFSGTRLTRIELESWLSLLIDLVETRNTEAVRNHLRTLVPEYQPQPMSRAGAEHAHAHAGSCESYDVRRAPWLGEQWHPSTRTRPIAQPSST